MRSIIFIIFFLRFIHCEAQENPSLNSLFDTLENIRKKGKYNALQTKAEKALEIAKQQNDIEGILKAKYFVASALQVNDFEKGVALLDSTLIFIDQLKENRYDSITFRIYVLKAVLHRKSGNYNMSLNLLHQVRSSIEKSTYKRVLFSCYRDISINLRNLGQYDSAQYYLLQCDRLANKLDDNNLRYYTLQGQANIHDALGEFEKSLALEKQLEKIAKHLDNENIRLTNLLNIGVSFANLEKLDSALVYYELGKILAFQLQDDEQLTLIHYNIGTVYDRLNIEVEAEESFKTAIALARKTKQQHVVIRSLHMLGRLFLEGGKLNKAQNYLNDALELANDEGILLDVMWNYEYLSKVTEAKGNYAEALTFHKEYSQLSDSILNTSKIETIKNLEEKYESEKKEQAIQLLEEQTKLQDIQLSQQKTITVILIVLSIAIIVILFLLYQQYRNNQEVKQWKMQQKMLRSQMNPHFIFNALTSIQNFVINEESELATSYLAKFAVLTRKVLEVSREESISLQDEISVIKEYCVLEGMRFNRQIDLQITSEPEIDLESTQIPPLLLQPFIENSLKHGFKDLETGKIDIFFKKNYNRLLIEITDNGRGFQQTTSTHNSLSMEIVKERLALIAPSKNNDFHLYSENTFSEKNEISGAKTNFEIPLKYAY